MVFAKVLLTIGIQQILHMLLCNYNTMYDIFETDGGKDGQKRMSFQFKMNISIVNALWIILTGERLDLQDLKLKVINRCDDKL